MTRVIKHVGVVKIDGRIYFSCCHNTKNMAAVTCNLKAYCDRVPKENQWKLDNTIDFENGGVPTHLGAIAEAMDEWEGRVADVLGLRTVDVSVIKAKHKDSLTLQTYVK